MSDDKQKTGPQDRERINLSEDYEVRYWTEALGINEQKLREAVHTVGTSAAAVRDYVRK
jgi:hypothetical protein